RPGWGDGARPGEELQLPAVRARPGRAALPGPRWLRTATGWDRTHGSWDRKRPGPGIPAPGSGQVSPRCESGAVPVGQAVPAAALRAARPEAGPNLAASRSPGATPHGADIVNHHNLHCRAARAPDGCQPIRGPARIRGFADRG